MSNTLEDLWNALGKGGAGLLETRALTITSTELRGLVMQLAGRFQQLGLSPGDRVVIRTSAEHHAFVAFAAAYFDGLVPSMLAADTGPDRFHSICNTLEASAILADATIRECGSTQIPVIMLDDEELALRQDAARPPRFTEASPDSLGYILFTSGTTAAPKGVEVTKGNILSQIATFQRLFGFNSGSRVLNTIPMSHADGLVFGPLLSLIAGTTLIRAEPFSLGGLESWLARTAAARPTHMVMSPTAISLIDRLATGDDYFRGARKMDVISVASLLRADLWDRFENRFGVRLFNVYGLTETVTGALYAGRHPEMGIPGTIGRPVDCLARLAPVQGIPPQSGEQGELQIRGPNVFRGYWRDLEHTQRTFAVDRWMRTGDMARLRDDGSFEFLFRIKAAINSGGLLIRGDEIDECLLRHPSVLECVTLGIPDQEFEEMAVSAVVLKSQAAEDDLLAHCRAELEALKVPKRIFIVQSIPRGEAGKPRLAEIRQQLLEKCQDAGEPPVQGYDDTGMAVIALASRVFRAPVASLTLSSRSENVPGWDSFTHVSLVLQAEIAFDIRIKPDEVTSLATLSDLAEVVRSRAPVVRQMSAARQQPTAI